MRKFDKILWCIGITAVVTVAAGCHRQSRVHASVSATISEFKMSINTPGGGQSTNQASASPTYSRREIKASMDVPAGLYPNCDLAAILAAGKSVSADGPLAIYQEKDAADIRFGNHQVRVEKDRLLLDGKECAKMPASTTNVNVVISDTTLTVAAESGNILTTNIGK